MTATTQTRQLNLRPRGRALLSSSFVAILAILFSAGCVISPSAVTVRKNGAPPQTATAGNKLWPESELSMTISPQDKLHIQILPVVTNGRPNLFEVDDIVRYHFSWSDKDYHILSGDELTIHFDSDSKLDQTLVVRPDGKVTVAKIAELLARGKSPSVLSSEIETALADRMNKPSVSVSVARSNLALAELSGESVIQQDGSISVPRLGTSPAAGLSSEEIAKALSKKASEQFENSLIAQVTRVPSAPGLTALAGFDRSLSVSADGRIGIPDLGSIDTNGRTVQMLENEIQATLHSLYKNNYAVVVGIESSDSRVVYVDGEVGRPGAYPLTPSLTTLKAIALAGGAHETADLSSVVLIHRNKDNDVFVYVTNLEDFVNKAAKDNDLSVSPQDIILVPRSAIAKADLWIDQYVNRLLPFSRSVSYSYNQGRTQIK